MKLLAILSVIGFAAASTVPGHLSWNVGHEYVFKYEGRLLTGLPDLAAHYSGVAINCTVRLQAKSATEYAMQIQDAKYSQVNQELNAAGAATQAQNNWRKLNLPQFSVVPSQAEQYLQLPVVFRLRQQDGEFDTISVSSQEPEWSVNFKKALVQLFQAKTQKPQQQSGIEQNLLTPDQVRGDDQQNVNFWKVNEQHLDGVCEVTYQINELPKYLIRDSKPELAQMEQQFCQGQRIFEIVRTRDVSKCTRRTALQYYKPGHFQCAQGNCQGMWSRSSVSRFVACGQSADQLVPRYIVNEGELQQELFGIKNEKFLTGTRQVLRLVQEGSISQPINEPSQAIQLKTMFFEYDLQNSYNDNDDSSASRSDIASFYKKFGLQGMTKNNFNPQQIMQEIQQQISQIVNQDLVQAEQLSRKELSMKVIKIARAFGVLQKDQIQSIYQQVKQQMNGDEDKLATMKNVFFDLVIMAGSKDAIEVVKQNIENNEMSQLQIAAIFMYLPSYVMVPNEQTLQGLFELITSSAIQNNPVTHNQGILGLVTLVNKACIAENRLTAYPTSIYGRLCNPESPIITQRLLPYLQQRLQQNGKQEEKNLMLVALGELGHQGVIPIVLPILESVQNQQQPQQSRMTRFLALYALTNAGTRYPGQVQPALFAVLSNQNEFTELRIAAFNSLLRLNPSQTYLHRIASLTWREQNVQVLNVINSALFSLYIQEEYQPLRTPSGAGSLQRKAWLVYPLIKKTGGTLPASATIFGTEFLPQLGVGYVNTLSYTTTGDSPVPVDFYSRITYLLNRFQFTPIQFGYRINGAENLIQQLVEVLTPEMSAKSRSEYGQKVKSEQLGEEWKEVIEKLNLKLDSEDNNQANGAVYAQIMESAPIFHSLRTSSAAMLKERIGKLLNKSPEQIKASNMCGQHKINIQRIHNLMPNLYEIPSEMGLPIIVEVHMPTVAAIQGQINVNCNGQNIIPSFELNMKKLYESSLTGFVGTLNPFTQQTVITGIQETAAITLPVNYNINYDQQQQKLKMSLKTLDSVSGPVEIVRFMVRPFTVAQQILSCQPFALSNNFKDIKSQAPRQRPVNLPSQFNVLGLNFNLDVVTESRFTDLRAMLEKLQTYNYNPLNVLRFMWASTALNEQQQPSTRYHNIKLILNPGQSATKQLDLELDMAYASKIKGEAPKYHVMKKCNSQEQSSSFPEWKKLIPVKFEKEILGQHSQHQQRQQKLKEGFEKINVDNGNGYYLKIKLNTQGGQSGFEWIVRYVSGMQALQQKWDLQMERQRSDSTGFPVGKLCVSGDMQIPSVPLWSLQQLRSFNGEFRYNNQIGFGQHDCSESKIQITGTSRTSSKQKQLSSNSEASKTLQKLIEKRVPLAKLSDVADKVRKQATTLDEVDFTVQYQNVPSAVMQVQGLIKDYAKALLWPYQNAKNFFPQPTFESRRSSVDMHSSSGPVSTQSQWQLRFHPEIQTVDVTISQSQPQETVTFTNLRLPNALAYFYPQNAGWNVEKAIGAGQDYYPTCRIEGKWMKTFDNQTTEAKVDDCFHVLTADSSYRKSFGVMYRALHKNQPEGPKEIKVFIGKSEIILTPGSGHSRYHNQIQLKVNGTTYGLPADKRVTIKDSKRDYVADVYESKDGVVVLQFLSCPITGHPSVVIKFDGQKIKVQVNPILRSYLTGMCGDLSGHKLASLVGPKKCVHKESDVLTASWRVSTRSKSCSPLPSEIQSQLRSDEQNCKKVQEIPTKLFQSYKAQVGQSCTRHTHEIIEKVNKYCFSQIPVITCSPACSQQGLSQKNVGYVCLQKGRVAERYAEKVRRGEEVPQLQSMQTEFTATMTLPRSCQAYNN